MVSWINVLFRTKPAPLAKPTVRQYVPTGQRSGVSTVYEWIRDVTLVVLKFERISTLVALKAERITQKSYIFLRQK